jgi:hypothetical protein
MMRVRNFLVDELSGANLQLQAIHALHAQVCAVSASGAHWHARNSCPTVQSSHR